MRTRSAADPGPRRIRFLPRLAGPATAVLVMMLACSRASVPAPESLAWARGGSAAEAAEAQPQPTPAPDTPASPTAAPTAAAPPPVASPTYPPTPVLSFTGELESIVYESQPGDTLWSLGIRFGVLPSDITSPLPLPADVQALLDPGQLLVIPRRLADTGPSDRLIPDSEFVFSPHAADFDVRAFAESQGGFLMLYQERLADRWRTGPDALALAARDQSVNPRLLLALLEYRAGWVTRPARPSGDAWTYPLGHVDPQSPGLYRQLAWLSNVLGVGYYGWRSGAVTEVTLADGAVVRLDPTLNAGTVALQYYFSTFLGEEEWRRAVGPDGFIATYRAFFGDPWGYYHPLYEPGVAQPPMVLPFEPGRVWALTGGPHGAWDREAAWAALDFAPPSVESGCAESEEWVVAAAAGLVVRSERGLVVLDLDGDGREQTGWVLMYLHVAEAGRVAEGAILQQGDRIGHPSCEGGLATGTHVHLARKYNGEWILADGPLPFTLSGWIARAGSRPYEGALVNGDRTVLACTCASQETNISR